MHWRVGTIMLSAVSTGLEAGISHRMSLATTLDSIPKFIQLTIRYSTIHTIATLALPEQVKNNLGSRLGCERGVGGECFYWHGVDLGGDKPSLWP